MPPPCFCKKNLGQQAHDVIALDEIPPLIEKATAIKITIPGDAHIRLCSPDGSNGRGPIFLQQWIRYPMRKMTIGLMMHLDESKRQLWLQQVDYRSGPAVTGIADNPQRLQHRTINSAQQMLQIVGSGSRMLHRTRPAGLPELTGFRQRPDGGKPGIATDGSGIFPHQLHAVVVLRVMTGRYHNATVRLQVRRGEIDFLGATASDIQHLHAGLRQTTGQRSAKRLR